MSTAEEDAEVLTLQAGAYLAAVASRGAAERAGCSWDAQRVAGTAAIAATLGLSGLEWACQAPWCWEEIRAVEVELREAGAWSWPEEPSLPAERPTAFPKESRLAKVGRPNPEGVAHSHGIPGQTRSARDATLAGSEKDEKLKPSRQSRRP